MANLTGSTTAVFFVRLSTAVDEIVDVDWNTRDGTAIAGQDYEAASGTVSFLPGETEKAIDVVVYGQDDVSADGKKFYIELKPPANAVLTDALAECVITVADEDGVLVTSLVIAQGKRGLKGNPGLSAYEQAVLMGYVGTVEQWMEKEANAARAAERAEAAAVAANIASKVFASPESGVNPNTGVPVGDYFNVRSPLSTHYVDEYQNIGGAAIPTGKSYPSATGLENAIAATEANAIAAEMAATAANIAGKVYSTPEAGVDPVTGVQNGYYYNVRSASNDNYIDEYQNVDGTPTATGKSYPSSSFVHGLAEYVPLPYKNGATYSLYERVTLTNGDIVKSTVDGNTNDPNVNMTGWLKPDILVSPDSFTGTTSQKLQSALNTGGYVVITKPYTIDAPLNINVENTKVWFYGAGKITSTVKDKNIINMYADNCKVLNANLQGCDIVSTELYYGTGITLHGVRGCEVSYAKITKTGGCPIALLARTVGSIVKSCVDNVIAYNDLDCDFAIKRTYDSAGILIGYSSYQGAIYSHDNNHIYANHIQGKTKIDHGIALIGQGNGNRFTQNTVFDCLEYGILVYQSPTEERLYDNLVSGNKVNNIGHVSDNLSIKGMGIYLQRCDSTVVHGNIIDNVLLGTNNDTNLSRAAIAVGGCVGVVVSDNIIENSKQFGIQFAECYGCKAANNFMDKVTRDLIRITSSSKIDITGNTGLNGGRYGVYVENFTRTTGHADYNGTSGDGINIVGNDLNCVTEGIYSLSSNAANKMIDSRIDSNLIKTPAISILLAKAENTSITSNKCKSTTALARIQVVESDKLTVNYNTVESTDATDSGRIALITATNYVVEGNLFSPSNSSTPIYINGQGFKAAKKRLYGTGVPSVGTYEAGDIIWNTSPVLGGSLGWICITSGSPGTWVQFGEIGGGLVSLTTTSLQNAALPINTVGKYAGKEVFNQTDSKKYYAEGNTPTSRWMRFDSGGSVTPA